MWISKKKHKEILREQRQDFRLGELADEIWGLEDDIRELKDRVKELENKKK